MKKTAFVIALAACSFSSSALAQQVTASVGADFSQGDFGSDIDTSILVIPATLRATFSKFSISVAVPYIEIDGATNILGGGEGPIITDPTAGVGRRSGLGDINVRASYNAFDLGDAAVTFHGRAKLPTGSRAQNLSTGELDYSGGIEIAATKGTVQPFAEIGYRVLGSPDGFQLNNGFYGTAGAVFMLPRNFVAIASYDYVERSVDMIPDVHSLFGGLVIPATDRINLTTYGTVGLSDSAADWGAGIMLSLTLNR